MRETILTLQICFLIVFNALCQDSLKLWYDEPARDWNEALPVGNGSLGAMIFGGVGRERLQLNEESVWAGGPEEFVNPKAKSSLQKVRKLLFQGKYSQAQALAQSNFMGDKKNFSAYQTLGDLHLDFDHPKEVVSEYRRELDISNATAKVFYRVGDVDFRRTIFSSAPAQSIVIQLTASKSRSISVTLRMSRPGGKALVTYKDNEISLYEHVNSGNGVKLFSSVRALQKGGSVVSNDTSLTVKNADEVIIILTAQTTYAEKDPAGVIQQTIDKVSGTPFQELLKEHVKDYQNYFRRVSFTLPATDAVYFPTDERLHAFQKGAKDPELISLYFQYGRYLLISSSRPGGLPANLQGIWADGLTPPWDADYHININIQMNYWPAEITGLPEMHSPFFQYLKLLSGDGRKTAKDMYGMRGAVAHFTSDAFHFTEPYGKTQWAMWPMGYAWSVQHLWQHYLFNNEIAFLDTLAYPLMKDAAEFCVEWLVEDPRTRLLVSGPSISPENTFKTTEGEVATMVMGPTMDHMIIRELFESTIQAATLLRKDERFKARLRNALERLTPTKVTTDGRIMEWTEEFEEPEPGHRHISHLYGLFPGSEISINRNSLLMDAARRTIAYRLKHGGGHTGWSRAWIVNFFARLQDGESAYDNLRALLSKSTLPNLFDTHPPFQIDGNFGAVSGITEMLVQSHAGEIHVLPALPSALPDGAIRGIRARGGFDVDVEWEGGSLKQLTVHANHSGDCNVRYMEKKYTFKSEAGKVYVFDSNLTPLRP